MIKKERLFIVIIILLLPVIVYATMPVNPSYVSPTGSGSTCTSVSPCALSYANSNAAAGDVVILKDGTYTTQINPSNSGTTGNMITFQKDTGATPLFTGVSLWAIELQRKSYIKIDGITGQDLQRFFFLGRGATHNEITNCTFTDQSHYGGYYSMGLITNYDSGFSLIEDSTNNWIHNNTFMYYGNENDCGNSGTIAIGSAVSNDMPRYNTVENNVFAYGGHDGLSILSGEYNVIRGNIFHNEEVYFQDITKSCINVPVSGFFGNRNLILDNNGTGTTGRNLIEGNRIGYAGTPANDDGAMGIEDAAEYTIDRYNFVYGNGASGIYGKNQGSGNNHVRIYNNSVYANGLGDSSIDVGYKFGILIWDWSGFPVTDVIIKNNIVYGNAQSDEIRINDNTYCTNCVVSNNLINTNPSFTDTTMTNKTSTTLPNLGILAGSSARDGGIYLTTTNGTGSGSTSLIVNDSFYFQAGNAAATSPMGSSLSNVQGDWVAVGTVSNIAQITDINYSTHTLTITPALSWSNGASVWLYKKSDGTRVLYGVAPDYGAYEYFDTGLPEVSSPIPSGSQPCGDITLGVTTPVASTCKWDTNLDPTTGNTNAMYPASNQPIAESPWLNLNWTTPGNIYADDGSTANITSAQFDTPKRSYVLKAYNFDMSAIPDGATILGVEAKINAWYRLNQGSASLDLCQLLDTSRNKVGTNLCSTPVALNTTNTTVITKGDNSTLWGNSLTSTWVKNSNFGIALGVQATQVNSDVDIDYVTLKVYWSSPKTYATYANTFTSDSTPQTTHTSTVSGLTCNQAYNPYAYILCNDGTNTNTSPTAISFSMQAADTTPPVISNGLPSGQIACGEDPLTVSLQAQTNENANCKYDTSDTTYDLMGSSFSTGQGTTNHSQSLSKACNATYTYYVRCADLVSPTPNKNTSSTTITWEITPFDQPPPDKQSIGATGAMTIGATGGMRIE